ITLDDLTLEGDPPTPPTSRPVPPRVSVSGSSAMRQYLRWGLAMLSLGAAGIHFAVMSDHFNLTWYHGSFFAATAWLQLAWAVAIVVRPSRRLLLAGIIGNLVVAEIWLVSRTIGIPFGPDSGIAEPVPFDPALLIDLSGVPGVSPEQQARAENLLAATVMRLPQWSDPAYDTAHGFFSIGDGVTGVEHYINLDFMADNTILDPDKPESLVFDTRVSPKRLVAAMYMATPGTTLSSVPDIGGPLTQWHIHNNLC